MARLYRVLNMPEQFLNTLKEQTHCGFLPFPQKFMSAKFFKIDCPRKFMPTKFQNWLSANVSVRKIQQLTIQKSLSLQNSEEFFIFSNISSYFEIKYVQENYNICF